jgi:hypothetical protein
MSTFAHLMAAHDTALLFLATGPAPVVVAGGGGNVPNPPAQAPPGVAGPVNMILGWIKWGSLIAGSIGLSWCGGKMMIGHRNRSNMAADGASGVPWVLLGLSLVAMSSALVGVFL